jgi:hypothetical protein
MAQRIYQIREQTKNKILKAIQSGTRNEHSRDYVMDPPHVEYGIVSEDITARDDTTPGTGKVILHYLDIDTGDVTPMYEPIERDVLNITERVIKEGEYVFVLEDYHGGEYYALPMPIDKRMRCSLADGNQFEEDTMADPHTSTSEQGITFEYTGNSGEEIYNPLKIKLWQGCSVHCEWNSELGRWEVYAAESDKVMHGVKRNDEECKFQKLDGASGWGVWDEGEDVPWVSEIRVECNAIKYDTLCTTDISAGEIDAITKIELNDDTCELYYYKKSIDQYGYCLETIAGTAGSLDFVTSVYASTGGLYYNKKCSGEYLIIELESCESTPPCGTCTWTSDDNLNWVQTDFCSGTCECVEPSFPPRVVGQTWTTNCEEP